MVGCGKAMRRESREGMDRLRAFGQEESHVECAAEGGGGGGGDGVDGAAMAGEEGATRPAAARQGKVPSTIPGDDGDHWALRADGTVDYVAAL